MLRRSSDRKTANLVTKGGNPAIKNAFGLPAGFSCPGMTAVCDRVCYAKRLERIPTVKGLRINLWRNYHDLLYASYEGGVPAMRALLVEMIRDFERDCDRRSAPKYFRIHWDGDFFSAEYAQAWADTCRLFPAVTFWVYTRSMFAVPILASVENVNLYVSTDSENYRAARAVVSGYSHVNIATLADTFSEARDMADNASNCPELAGAIPLISPKGSACMTCGLCPNGRKDVAFSISGA